MSKYDHRDGVREYETYDADSAYPEWHRPVVEYADWVPGTAVYAMVQHEQHGPAIGPKPYPRYAGKWWVKLTYYPDVPILVPKEIIFDGPIDTGDYPVSHERIAKVAFILATPNSGVTPNGGS